MAILISVRPEWVEKILNGLKTIEVRTNCPKEWKDYFAGKIKIKPEPEKCYTYCTKNKPYLYRIDDDDMFELTNKIKYLEDWEYGYIKDYNAQNGKIVAEWTLDEIDKFQVFENGSVQNWNGDNLEKSCLTYDELANYIGKGKTGYAWHISNLKIYDNPKELGEFKKPCPTIYDCCCCKYWKNGDCNKEKISRPPQSWMFCEELEGK